METFRIPNTVATTEQAMWVYHVWEDISPDAVHVYTELHGADLPAAEIWCITHRPATACLCGCYALEWE